MVTLYHRKRGKCNNEREKISRQQLQILFDNLNLMYVQKCKTGYKVKSKMGKRIEIVTKKLYEITPLVTPGLL